MKALLVFFCWVFLQTAHAYQVTDDRGVSVSFAQPPRRIVSLLPSLTETVCALGQCDRLVGVDRYSNYPDRVKKLPQVGGGLDPNIEAIVALKPDRAQGDGTGAKNPRRCQAGFGKNRPGIGCDRYPARLAGHRVRHGGGCAVAACAPEDGAGVFRGEPRTLRCGRGLVHW